MTNFILEPGENQIDTWIVIYQAPDGNKYNGKLLVTDKNIYYDAKFDLSIAGILEETMFVKSDSDGYLVIPKKRIAKTETKKNFLDKQIILTLDNGQIHVFDYGMLNVDKIAKAINQG